MMATNAGCLASLECHEVCMLGKQPVKQDQKIGKARGFQETAGATKQHLWCRVADPCHNSFCTRG